MLETVSSESRALYQGHQMVSFRRWHPLLRLPLRSGQFHRLRRPTSVAFALGAASTNPVWYACPEVDVWWC